MPRIVDIANAGWRAVLNDLGKITKIFDNEGDDINIPLLETHPLSTKIKPAQRGLLYVCSEI